MTCLVFNLLGLRMEDVSTRILWAYVFDRRDFRFVSGNVNEMILHLIFAASAIAVAYVYLGYPALLLLFSGKKRLVPPQAAVLPRITFLISAYNERRLIATKLRNTLSLDYPSDHMQILVISDCSGDGTDEVVKSFAPQGVQLIRQTKRLGKSAGLNTGVSRATGEILVFSDANAMYQSDAVRQLVRHFSDEHVGYVVGDARYVEASCQSPSAHSEGLYWKLETWLKQKESDFGSVVGGDGAIYAIRRELFTPLLPTDINDFLNPLQIISHGYRGVFEPAAVCFEEAGDSFEKEFRRKVRIISRSLNAVRRAPVVVLPWKQPRHWLALMSHKLLRWFVPVFLLALLLIPVLFLRLPVYRAVLEVQLVFYALGMVGFVIKKRRTVPRIFALPYYFCLVNIASLFGIVKFFCGSLTPTWETIRQETRANQDSSGSLSPS
jgi:cellulose synthase/poly-beta-1,6-N-acetylglucosamine synthase-like glycosyltransferase